MLIGIILCWIWTLLTETNNSIQKIKTKKYHILKVWAITSFFWMLTFSTAIIYKLYFHNIELYFNQESLPFIIIRILLEIAQSYVTVMAIKYCDRSTFSFLRILTIPLLVIADIMLWYQFTNLSFIGIWIILLSFLVFNTKKKSLNFKWRKFAIFTAINAVITLSLFKYSIAHFWNSLEIDQLIMTSAIFIFFLIYWAVKTKSFVLKPLIKEKIFIVQWLAIWLASMAISYSYLYLNASEATSIVRAWWIFWSIVAWILFFKA